MYLQLVKRRSYVVECMEHLSGMELHLRMSVHFPPFPLFAFRAAVYVSNPCIAELRLPV